MSINSGLNYLITRATTALALLFLAGIASTSHAIDFLESDLGTVSLKDIRHNSIGQLGYNQDSPIGGSSDWIFGFRYTLEGDDIYKDWQHIRAVIKDEEQEESLISGWVSIVDTENNEWIQEQRPSFNQVMLSQSLELDWVNVKTGEKRVGSQLSMESLWINRLDNSPELPESVYVGLYATDDIVMGKTVKITALHDGSQKVMKSQAANLSITELKIDGKEEGDGFESGDYASAEPRIEALLTDNTDLLKSYSVSISKGDTVVYTSSSNITGAPNQFSVDDTVPSRLSDGTYLLQLEGVTTADEISSKEIQFKVAEGLALSDFIVGPVPYDRSKDSLNIEYQLSQSANIELRIYDVSGELQKKWEINAGESGAEQGFNRIEWDGMNRYGEAIANGPYVLYVLAENGSETDSSTTKMVALQ